MAYTIKRHSDGAVFAQAETIADALAQLTETMGSDTDTQLMICDADDTVIAIGNREQLEATE